MMMTVVQGAALLIDLARSGLQLRERAPCGSVGAVEFAGPEV